jgi:hypothetical protein
MQDSLSITISAIGYKKFEQVIQTKLLPGLQEIDLGNFRMEIEAQVLANVTVVATQPTMKWV